MTVVSSKEFTTHQRKYFGMAMNNEVRIKRGRNMFRLMHEPTDDVIYHEPDEDLRRSITKDELLAGIFEDMEKIFAKR